MSNLSETFSGRDPRQKIFFCKSADAKTIRIENLTLIRPDSRIPTLQDSPKLVENINLELKRGDRLAITGANGTGKSTLLRGLVGFWPWGEGKITMPSAIKTMPLPQKEFISDLPFREALSYAEPSTTYSEDELRAVLKAVRLDDRLMKYMDGESITGAALQRELSGGEKQRFRFAGILLRKPDILIMDEVTSSLDEETGLALYKLITDVLPKETILISVIHRKELLPFHNMHAEIKNRQLTVKSLVNGVEQGHCVTPCAHCSISPRPL